MNEKILFEEKQYLGYNKYSNVRRIVLGIFCFIAYYLSENKEGAAQLLFVMGIVIMVISALLIFVLHLHTQVIESSIILDGLWTARRVKVDLHSIVSVKAVPAKRFILTRPVYNLHWKGNIRFYTRGKEAVELVDKEGLRYIIGSQMSGQLMQVLKEQIDKVGIERQVTMGT
ncbi:MAG: hypothetical protein ABII90_04830 [Bacteroidota bacterium]